MSSATRSSEAAGRDELAALEPDPLWYKDAIIYQVHVRAFFDSNGDGIGDFAGLASKLDYLRDLGVTALWLLPFYPSPLRDDGYDISDYAGIHPAYGKLADFRHFLREAHERGLRVITELVVNHTSDQHPWFQRARRAPAGSVQRDFYVWSDTTERYKEARIIFKDFESSNWSWDALAGAYYWHRFYSHQPDLNYHNPEVRRAIARVMDRWFAMGVDGLRLDAVPYLHERDGTSCENLPETHEELRRLRRHVDSRYDDRMLLGEANQWPDDAVAYFGQADECHMAFHFPLMPRMFMGLRMEDRYPIVDIMSQTPSIPESCQWALFLRNHDELTLEMVTDEERDYMYRVYAHDAQARINFGIRRRLAPLLGNDRRRIELMNGLLFSLPGTPIVYYGDEIGMGDNIYLGDRNGVRTPMQWSSDRNAGFSRANPQKLYLPVIIDPIFSYETVNVEAQHDNPHSLLWWMRQLIALRRRFKCFGRGSLEFLYPANRKVLAFLRQHGEERVLVVANLSRYVQYAELDLAPLRGLVPVEAFGRNELAPIGEAPYVLTLGPHSFYWLSLEPPPKRAADVWADTARQPPRLALAPRWQALLKGRGRAALEEALPDFLRTRRWFRGQARRIRSVQVADSVAVPANEHAFQIALVHVDYTDGDPETYLLTLGMAAAEKAAELRRSLPQAVVAELGAQGEHGIVHGAARERDFAMALLEVVARRRRLKGSGGEIVASATKAGRAALDGDAGALEPALLNTERSHSAIGFGQRMVLKLFRKLEPGPNPELEAGAFLTETVGFPHVPPLLGALEYRPARGEPTCLGVLFGYVPNEGYAWQFTLDALSRYYDSVLVRSGTDVHAPKAAPSVLELAAGEIAAEARALVGTYLESARLLGQRVAELHLALACRSDDREFAPEPFNPVYQRSLYQSMRNLTEEVFQSLRRGVKQLPEGVRSDAEALLSRQADLLRWFRAVLERSITAARTRTHGDLHLGRVLWTGRDFVIVDFEGEPMRPLSSVRLKRSPLRDVASMIRSFHYAAFGSLAAHVERGAARPEDRSRLEGWAEYWSRWTASAFLRSYLRTSGSAAFVPAAREQFAGLLSVHLLEKALSELGYELSNPRGLLHVPLRGVLQLLEARAAASSAQGA